MGRIERKKREVEKLQAEIEELEEKEFVKTRDKIIASWPKWKRELTVLWRPEKKNAESEADGG